MAKKVASFRLETDLLDWVGSYAKTRGSTQAVVLEQALLSFKRDAEAGVPDLPVPDSPEVRALRAAAVPGVVLASSIARRPVDPDVAARQVRLNAAQDRRKAEK